NGGPRAGKTGPQHDVRHLRYGGVGKAALDVGLLQGANRAVHNGKARDQRQRNTERKLRDPLQAVNIVYEAHNAKGAGLDYGYGMQQRTDRCGCGHSAWQPSMQWYESSLYTQPCYADQKNQAQ